MSALFDFPSLLIVILLFVCCTTFTKSLYPSLFTQINNTEMYVVLVSECLKNNLTSIIVAREVV